MSGEVIQRLKEDMMQLCSNSSGEMEISCDDAQWLINKIDQLEKEVETKEEVKSGVLIMSTKKDETIFTMQKSLNAKDKILFDIQKSLNTVKLDIQQKDQKIKELGFQVEEWKKVFDSVVKERMETVTKLQERVKYLEEGDF